MPCRGRDDRTIRPPSVRNTKEFPCRHPFRPPGYPSTAALLSDGEYHLPVNTPLALRGHFSKAISDFSTFLKVKIAMRGLGPGLFILRPIKKTLKSPKYFLSAFSVKTFLPVKGSLGPGRSGFPRISLLGREKEESTAVCNTIDGGRVN